jgi:hypothetical protein
MTYPITPEEIIEFKKLSKPPCDGKELWEFWIRVAIRLGLDVWSIGPVPGSETLITGKPKA